MRRGNIVALGTAAIFIVPSAGGAWADFVCPVPVSSQGFEHQNSRFITISGGDTSILPGEAGNEASSPVEVPDSDEPGWRRLTGGSERESGRPRLHGRLEHVVAQNKAVSRWTATS